MTGPAPARYRDIFRFREFRILFAAHLASLLGDVVAAVALMVLVYERTRSPGLAALTMSVVFVPYLFGGALLSGAVDRWPARRTLVACHVASAVLVAAMVMPGLSVALLLMLLFAVGLLAPLFQGVRAALLPQVLPPGPPYVLGRSVMRMVAQVAQVVGYGVAGVLLILVSARGALVVDVVSFLVSAALLRFGTAARPARALDATADAPSRSMVTASLAAVRQVLSLPDVRRVLLFEWVVPACAVAPEALAAAYVARLGLPGSDVGWYLTAVPLGAIAADVVAGRMLGPRGQARLIVPAPLLACVALMIFAARPALAPTLAVLFVVGVGYAYGPGLDQRLVDVAPADLLGSTLSVASSGLMFVQGVGFAVWGFAAQLAPIGAVVPVAGALAAASVVALSLPRRRPMPAGEG